jgi:hypothetical protein
MPETLKKKAIKLARKNEMSFNAYINHWMQIAVTREETIEWMRQRLHKKDSEKLLSEFGIFLDKTKQGKEPSATEIKKLLKK